MAIGPTPAIYLARNSAKDPWRTLEKFKRFEGANFAPLPNRLFLSAPHQRRAAIWQMDLDENSDFQLVFSHPDVDAEDIVAWPDEHVVGLRHDTEQPHIHFIDPQAEAVDRLMDKTVPWALRRAHRRGDRDRQGETRPAIPGLDRVPVLLVHGDDDYTVLLSQSDAMAKALKGHGVPNELVVIAESTA